MLRASVQMNADLLQYLQPSECLNIRSLYELSRHQAASEVFDHCEDSEQLTQSCTFRVHFLLGLVLAQVMTHSISFSPLHYHINSTSIQHKQQNHMTLYLRYLEL